MLCIICKENEAKVHLTQIVGDKMQKVDLCEECAKQKGVNDPAGFSLADLLLGLGASQEMEKGSGGEEIKCPLADSPRPISKRPAASVAPNVTRPSRKVWKACSRPCTRAPSTWARSRRRFARVRDLSDALKHLAEDARQSGGRRGFRAGCESSRRDQINPRKKSASSRPLNDEHPRISHTARRNGPPRRAAQPDRDVQPRPAGAQPQGFAFPGWAKKAERIKRWNPSVPPSSHCRRWTNAFSAIDG